MPAIARIEENLDEIPRQVVADGGYVDRGNIVAMERAGIDLIGPLMERNRVAGQVAQRGVHDAFRPERFTYDAASDTYTCPEGKTLTRNGQEKRTGRTRHIYRGRTKDCTACPSRGQCCPGVAGRRSVVRSVDDPEVTSFIEKMNTEEAKEIYKQRAHIAEFPNAWIKEKLGLRQFHLRGLLKVGMEALWACLTYNVQQGIRLVWRPRLA